jgi:hypothetical protein
MILEALSGVWEGGILHDWNNGGQVQSGEVLSTVASGRDAPRDDVRMKPINARWDYAQTLLGDRFREAARTLKPGLSEKEWWRIKRKWSKHGEVFKRFEKALHSPWRERDLAQAAEACSFYVELLEERLHALMGESGGIDSGVDLLSTPRTDHERNQHLLAHVLRNHTDEMGRADDFRAFIEDHLVRIRRAQSAYLEGSQYEGGE